MNLLIDRCPEAVEISGDLYEIRSDFRTSILFEMAMYDSRLSETQKVATALSLYYEKLPDSVEGVTEAFKAALKFYNLGKELPSSSSNGSSATRNNVYSFEHDDEYIYTSFMAAYKIDLTDRSNVIHWWKFKSLFSNLPEDTIMKKIISIRGSKIDNNMSKEEKKRIKKLKEIYKLPSQIEDREEIFNDAMSSLF